MSQGKTDDFFPDILILAGLNKTSPLSSDADALQPGEWGVDVVETQSAESFLMAMGWEEKTAGKSIEDVFKVERGNGLQVVGKVRAKSQNTDFDLGQDIIYFPPSKKLN